MPDAAMKKPKVERAHVDKMCTDHGFVHTDGKPCYTNQLAGQQYMFDKMSAAVGNSPSLEEMALAQVYAAAISILKVLAAKEQAG